MKVTGLFLFIKTRVQIRMLQLILLMGSAALRALRASVPPAPAEPFPAGQGGSRQLPAQLGVPRPFPGAGMSGASLVPSVHTENKQAAVAPRGRQHRARRSRAGSLPPRQGCWVPQPGSLSPGQPRSRAPEPIAASQSGSGAPCLCLTTALMEKLVGFRGFKATVFRAVFPKDSRGCFPVALGCDTPGAPGRDSPAPSQLCRVPLDTDSRSPKTFGGRDIKPTTVMRSEGSRLGILSRCRENFGIEFCTFAGLDVKTQNPKKPKG